MPNVKFWSVILFGIVFVSGLKIINIKHETKAEELYTSQELNRKHAFYNEEIECLATNLYHEARNESKIGQMAVNFVVFNRVRSENFPNTICEVTLQAKSYKSNGEPTLNSCQFSWYCDGRADEINNVKKYNEIHQLSQTMFYNANRLNDVTEGALYYHADYVNPKWSKIFEKVVQIDTHIFYKTDD